MASDDGNEVDIGGEGDDPMGSDAIPSNPGFSFFGRNAADELDDQSALDGNSGGSFMDAPESFVNASGVDTEGVQDFLPPFANRENIELSKEIRSKELTLDDTERKLNENAERVKIMSDHNRNVQEEISFVANRLEAKQKEVETEAHLRQLSQREIGRYEADKKKLEAQQADLREKLVSVQRQVWEGNEKMDQFKLLMNWNQEELEQWALASKQK